MMKAGTTLFIAVCAALYISNGASPIGTDGKFYLENIATGTHQALNECKEGECKFNIDLPDSKETFIETGTLKCSRVTLGATEGS